MSNRSKDDILKDLEDARQSLNSSHQRIKELLEELAIILKQK